METIRNCYDFLISPQPVVDFQKFCSVRPKYECSYKEDDIRNEKQCNGNCYCGNSSSLINSKENHNISAGNSLVNGHYDSLNPQIKSRKPGVVNGYKNGYHHDINQNGTVFQNGDIHNISEEKKKTDIPAAPEYIIGNYLIFAIFRFGAELGNEFFYVIFYTFSLWNFDTLICLKIALVWVLLMYVGQSLKDVLRWERPASPPVFQLEERYVLEYGMPSTHAMAGTAIPFMLLMYAADRYEFSIVVGLVIAVLWCTLVCLSRIYLGMHSILDLLAGLLLVTILLAIMVPYAEDVVLFLVTYKYGGLISLGASITLTVIYPTLDKWSSARGDTTVFLGVVCGFFVGTWVNYELGFLTKSEAILPHPNKLMELSWVKNAMLRMLVGVIATVFLRFIMKLLTFNLLCYLLNKDPKDPKTRKILVIELTYKYWTYFALAVNGVILAPLIYIKLGIDRPSFYSDMF